MNHKVVNNPSRGFVLMMVLVIIMITAVVLVGVARRSFGAALEANSAELRLRSRWAVISARPALLNQAAQLLTEAQEDRDEPAARTGGELELQGLNVKFIVTDEQAKLNVNQLLQSAGAERAAQAVRRLVLRSVRSTQGVPQVRLQPVAFQLAQMPQAQATPHIDSFAQVFENPSPAILLGSADRPGASDLITCWGNGRLHLAAADSQVIREVCGPVVGPSVADQLVRLSRSSGFDLTQIISSLELGEEQRRLLQELLTDRSYSHGLWLEVTGGPAVRYHLTVTSGEEQPEVAIFDW